MRYNCGDGGNRTRNHYSTRQVVYHIALSDQSCSSLVEIRKKSLFRRNVHPLYHQHRDYFKPIRNSNMWYITIQAIFNF